MNTVLSLFGHFLPPFLLGSQGKYPLSGVDHHVHDGKTGKFPFETEAAGFQNCVKIETSGFWFKPRFPNRTRRI